MFKSIKIRLGVGALALLASGGALAATGCCGDLACCLQGLIQACC